MRFSSYVYVYHVRPALAGALLLLALLLLLPSASAQSATGRITGTVADAATAEPLVGVNVVVVGTVLGAATDADGRFEITQVPLGTVALEARFVGFEPSVTADVLVRAGRPAAVRIALREAVFEGEAVTVTAGYFDRDPAAPTSAARFQAEEIRRAPGAAGEVARVLNALPGVAARGETSQDLFVRGGSPFENAFYVDGILIPVAQHFATGDGASFGPTGLLNSAFVEDVSFSRGAFSAATGNRLSSVANIRYREGSSDRYAGELGLNFAGGQLVLEGPIGRRGVGAGMGGAPTGTFFVSGRRSYLDLVAGAVNAGGAPRFGDLQGKATFDLGGGHRLTALNLFGESQFEQSLTDAWDDGESDAVFQKNRQNTAGLVWRAPVRFGAVQGVSETAGSHSIMARSFDFTSVVDDGAGSPIAGIAGPSRESATDHLANLRHVTRLAPSARVQLEVGAEGLYEHGQYASTRDAYAGIDGSLQPAIARDLGLGRSRVGAFATASLRPTARLTVSPGLRVDYNALAEETYVQPRLALSYQLTDRLTANAAGGLYRQAVPLWTAAQADENRDLSDPQALHLVGGADYQLAPEILLTVEGFWKDYTDVPEATASSPLQVPSYALDSRGDFVGPLQSTGESEAYGVEMLIQKKLASGLYGLVSAAYVRARYRDLAGTWRNRDFDTRGQFSAVGGWKPNAKWELSARWSYLGGRPTTPIDAAASAEAGQEVRDGARVNEDRLPAYHSLFVRGDRRWRVRSTEIVAFVSLWNAYGRDNADDLFWNVRENSIDQRSQFGTLPIVGLEVAF